MHNFRIRIMGLYLTLLQKNTASIHLARNIISNQAFTELVDSKRYTSNRGKWKWNNMKLSKLIIFPFEGLTLP